MTHCRYQTARWSWLLAGIFVSLCPACTSWQPVQPWEKGHLARTEMTFEADSLDSKYIEHIYFSKEAASGGASVGGGGCGCN